MAMSKNWKIAIKVLAAATAALLGAVTDSESNDSDDDEELAWP